MELYSHIIIGSGPSGVSAALELENAGVAIIDVGISPKSNFEHKSLSEGLLFGDSSSILGKNWEMLANIVYPNLMHSKLRSSGMRHISTGEPFDLRFGKNGESLKGRNSYAAGGLSNAWGAQLFRYTEKDLADVDGWPIDLNSLTQSYLSLEEHIGISGSYDALEDFLGPASSLLPPQELVPAANHLLRRFNSFQGDKKILIGHTRIGVLTKNFRQYKSHQFGETDFFSTKNEGIYTALRSLEELRSRGRMKYFGGYKLISFSEGVEFVEITLECVKTGEITKKRAKHLLLGCGTQQTARLVLLNKNGVNKSLPFMDHPPTLLPLFIPRMFGSSLPDKSYPIQLAATLCGDSPREMISLYYPGGLLRSDFLRDIPLPMNIASKVLPGLLGGMLVAQIWEPSKLFSGNRLYLDAESNIHIDYPYRSTYQRYGKLLSAFARLGAFSLPSMAIVSPPGTGFHYAGCLPMRKTPAEFETHVNGLLWDSKRVRVIDASIFPSLPAKNHSLTLMANASRIAKEVLRCGY